MGEFCGDFRGGTERRVYVLVFRTYKLTNMANAGEKTNKCEICGRRFRVQYWKVGKERDCCFTCLTFIDFLQTKAQEDQLDGGFIAEPIFSARDALILGELFSKEHKTLEQVGKQFHLTRGRIMQIRDRGMMFIKRLSNFRI